MWQTQKDHMTQIKQGTYFTKPKKDTPYLVAQLGIKHPDVYQCIFDSTQKMCTYTKSVTFPSLLTRAKVPNGDF
jgi:hypothetical protein